MFLEESDLAPCPEAPRPERPPKGGQTPPDWAGAGGVAGPRLWWVAALCGAAALAALLAGCGQPPPPASTAPAGARDTGYRVRNPSATRASVTGRGCGGTAKEAVAAARQDAAYNLRSVTGPARYEIAYTMLDQTVAGGQICVETEATATPSRRR